MNTCITMEVYATTTNGLINFFVGDVAPIESRLEGKVCCSTLICIALCHAHIIYVHSIFPRMSKACIYLGVHYHPVSSGTCRESLDMDYQCIANKVVNWGKGGGLSDFWLGVDPRTNNKYM